MSDGLLHVRVEGTPREMGLRHGDLARKLIEANVGLYFHRFREEWGLPEEEVRRRAQAYAGVIKEIDPEYQEAMQGVAEGSQLPYLDVVALNVRYEIVYSEYSKMGRELGLPSGCTALGLLPNSTVEGHLLMAQNWDWIPGVRGLVQHYRLPRGPEILSFTEAGILGGKIGLNSRGLGLMINGLLSDQDSWQRLGMPFHVRCWQILMARSLSEAANTIKGGLGSCSANFVIGQVEGEYAAIVDLETCPLGAEELHDEDGVITHTNHFHKAEALGIWEPLLEEKTTTFERQQRIDALVKRELRKGERISSADIRRFLADHDGRPGSICRHQQLDLPEEQRYQTVVSAIMDLHDRTLRISAGNPCDTKYETYRLRHDENREQT